jgi:hypothetical protein
VLEALNAHPDLGSNTSFEDLHECWTECLHVSRLQYRWWTTMENEEKGDHCTAQPQLCFECAVH